MQTTSDASSPHAHRAKKFGAQHHWNSNVRRQPVGAGTTVERHGGCSACGGRALGAACGGRGMSLRVLCVWWVRPWCRMSLRVGGVPLVWHASTHRPRKGKRWCVVILRCLSLACSWCELHLVVPFVRVVPGCALGLTEPLTTRARLAEDPWPHRTNLSHKKRPLASRGNFDNKGTLTRDRGQEAREPGDKKGQRTADNRPRTRSTLSTSRAAREAEEKTRGRTRRQRTRRQRTRSTLCVQRRSAPLV